MQQGEKKEKVGMTMLPKYLFGDLKVSSLKLTALGLLLFKDILYLAVAS